MQKRFLTLGFVAGALCLGSAAPAAAQVVYNPYTGGYVGAPVVNPYMPVSGEVNTMHNPYTGTTSAGEVAHNPYTGTTAGRETSYNPYTGTATRTTEAYNPYTGRSASYTRTYRR